MKINTPRPAKQAKSGLFRIIFSRAGIILLLILLQLGIFVATTLYLEEYRAYIYSAFKILSVAVLIYIFNEEENPAFKMTWMLFVLVFPVVSTIFYIYVQTQPGTKLMQKRLADLRIETAPYMQQNQEVVDAIWASKSANANLAFYLSNRLGFPTYRNTEVKYFPLGEYKFKYLIAELKKAEKFIFMEYFIVEEGYMWSTILKVLRQKVKEGVEVRFMYDGMCAISMLPYTYPKQLKKYGIKCKMANPMKPFLSTVQNNRDHRKICVIDGKVGFTGGINLGDEYINKKVRFGHWKDTAVMLKGDAVQSLTMIFLQMWNVEERHPENYEKYLTPKRKELR
ncbi:MAG: phospholipase D-like domain-containing protein, partial [Dorea sp.]